MYKILPDLICEFSKITQLQDKRTKSIVFLHTRNKQRDTKIINTKKCIIAQKNEIL